MLRSRPSDRHAVNGHAMPAGGRVRRGGPELAPVAHHAHNHVARPVEWHVEALQQVRVGVDGGIEHSARGIVEPNLGGRRLGAARRNRSAGTGRRSSPLSLSTNSVGEPSAPIDALT